MTRFTSKFGLVDRSKLWAHPTHGAGCQPGPAEEGEDRVSGCSTDGAPKPHYTQLHEYKIRPIPRSTSAARGHRQALHKGCSTLCLPKCLPMHTEGGGLEKTLSRQRTESFHPSSGHGVKALQEREATSTWVSWVFLWVFFPQASQCVQGWILLLWESASLLQPEQDTDFHSTI